MVFLAVDQSTSGTKAILFNENAELLEQTHVAHRQIYPQPGWVEHDAEEIYQNTLQAVGKLLAKHPELKSTLAGLSITNQRETFVIFDSRSGEPLYNAIVWQCRRGEAVCEQLNAAGFGNMVHHLTGLMLDTYFPASKLRWLLDARPDLHRRLDDGSALFGTIDTYLIFRLTGGKVYATDHTNASRTLFYDINRLNWNSDLLDLFGVQAARLPEIHESAAIYGETTLDGLLEKPIRIAGVMGDSQAALFAQRCFTPGSAKITFGSGSSILLNIGTQGLLSENGIVTAVGWVYQGQPTYAFEGITNFTGAIVAWLRDQLQLIQSADETEELANSVPDTGGVYMVPAFVGFSAPYWRPDARAAIVGMTPSTRRAHVVRAALESIDFLLTDVLNLLKKESGVELSTIHADGGATRNHFLMQFLADNSRLIVRVSGLPELSALGAVMNGGLGLGIYSSMEDLLSLPTRFIEYQPQMEISRVEALNQGWQKAVSQILYKG